MDDPEVWTVLDLVDLVGYWGEALINCHDPDERAKIAWQIADSPEDDLVPALLLLLTEFYSPILGDNPPVFILPSRGIAT